MKCILVTGSSGDIGFDILKSILKETNLNIIAMYNSNCENIDDLEKYYKNRIVKIKCDFNQELEIEKAKFEIKKYSICAAVFCAGVSRIQMINKMTNEDINKIININLKAPIELATVVSDIMVKEKSGNIIFISSMWGIDGASCESVYSASKGGLIAFSKALSRELGPSNIRVNTISPGFIDTKMNSNLSKEEIGEFIKEIPLMRAGNVKDISNLVLFLLSDKSTYISGSNIKIDGGYI